MSVERNQTSKELKRVAKLRWRHLDGRPTYGSGYLVSPSVVLTAAHVVEDTNHLEVRLDPTNRHQSWQGGIVVWRGRKGVQDREGVDLALVQLESPTELLGLVRFASLGEGIASHSCRGVGFPDYKFRSESSGSLAEVRDTAQLNGELRLGSNLVLGQWELQLNQNPLPAPGETDSLWPGISGTAVLVGECVVGVVIIHPQREGTTVLQVQPLDPVLSQPEFCQQLTGDDRPLYYYDPWGLLTSPYQALPRETEPSVAMLLQPVYGTVPFEGRQTELEELHTWLNGDVPFRLWLQLGAGGSGKTRLISELADHAGRTGWLSGWLPAPGELFMPANLQPYLASSLPLLLLLDEAHWRKSEDLALLLNQVMERDGKCRLVFVARTDGDWWDHLKVKTADTFAQSAVDGAFKKELKPLVSEHEKRIEAYEHALSAFAQILGKSCPAQPHPLLIADDYQSILMVQAEALLTVLGEQGAKRSPDTLWRKLLYREQKYWEQLSRSIAAFLIDPENPDRDLKELVGLATLTGAQGPEEGQRVLQALHWLKGSDRQVCLRLDRWLHKLYPDREHWSPLKPDRLADALLAELLAPESEFTEALPELVQKGSRAQLAHSLSVLSRMSLQYPDNANFAIDQLLAADPQTLLPIAITVAPQAGKTLGKGIELLLRRKPLELSQSEEFLDLLPQSSIALADVAVILTQQVLASVKAAGNDETSRAEQARLLNNLSNRLADVEDRLGALRAIQDAVSLYRDLAAVSPDAFLPDLASSLNSLSVCLSRMGDRPRALRAIQDAVSLYRDLAAVSPDDFLPNLARLLHNLSNRLSEMGDRLGALRAIQDAVSLHRDLAAVSPEAYWPALASSLNSLSVCLSEVGDRARALEAMQEAVKLCRDLAVVSPDAFLPNLASSLDNLSVCLSRVGDRPRALEASQESVSLYQDLAAVSPDAFRPGLAMSLNNLSNRLSAVGDRPRALRAIQESVLLYRDLAAVSPDAFRPDLARSLDNLSNHLSAVGDRLRALRAIQESVSLYQDLAGVLPHAFLPDLAISLSNLSNHLSAIGDRPGALAAIQRAVSLYQDLAAVAPDAFRPHLALSLNNLSNRLSDVGDRPRALAAIQDAVAIYQDLATLAPDAFRPDLALSLNNLSIRLSDVGDRPGALAAIQDAVAIYQDLAALAPDAFRPNLALSLNNLSIRLSDVEQLAEALIVGQQAVELYRALASQSPQFFRSNLADSLDTVARCLSQLNQTRKALETIQEAMELVVSLLQNNPQAYTGLVDRIRTLYLNLCEENHITPNPELLAGGLSTD